MARKITLSPAEAAEPVEVELFDHLFTLKPITRSVQKELEKVEPGVRDEDDSDRVVEVLAAGLDALLANANGKNTAAKKVIVDAWKGDRLNLQQLNRLYEDLQEAAVENRPT